MCQAASLLASQDRGQGGLRKKVAAEVRMARMARALVGSPPSLGVTLLEGAD